MFNIASPGVPSCLVGCSGRHQLAYKQGSPNVGVWGTTPFWRVSDNPPPPVGGERAAIFRVFSGLIMIKNLI